MGVALGVASFEIVSEGVGVPVFDGVCVVVPVRVYEGLGVLDGDAPGAKLGLGVSEGITQGQMPYLQARV